MNGSRRWLGAAALVLAVGTLVVSARGAAPPRPTGKLTAEQQRQLARLGEDLTKAAQAGRMAEAVRLAKQAESLRRTWQGAGHWQAVDAHYEIEGWQRLARLTEADQRQMGEILRRKAEGDRQAARHRYGEAEKVYREVLDLTRKLLSEGHPSTALSYNNLAANLNAQGKHAEAQPLLQKALDLRKKLLGEGHPDTAASYNNLASNLDEQGKYAQAKPLYQKALELCRKLGEGHPRMASSYNNLAMNLGAQGRHAEAQPLYQKALELRLKLLGEEQPLTALSYNNLAMNLGAQGKYAEAQPLLQKALDLHKKVLGEEHPLTALSYDNLGVNLAEQGKYAEAQSLLQKALDQRKKLLSEGHPETARSYNNLAANLNAQGKYAQAQPLLQKALDLHKRLLGEEHPRTATSYDNLAMNLNRQGKSAEAQPLLQKALDLRKKLLGEEHPLTAQSYGYLALNLHQQGKHAQAQPLFQKALDLYRKLLGEGHPDTATSYNYLAHNLNEQGKYAEAQPLYQKALDLHKRLLGEEHPLTAGGYSGLAINLNEQGKHAEAQPLLQKALDLRKKLLGEGHPSTASSYNNLARNLNSQGKHAQAQPLYQKALDLRLKLGEGHPDTASSYSGLASNLNAQGKYAEAQTRYQKALDLHKRLLGEEHPLTASSYSGLGANLGALGKHAEAQPLLQKALDLRLKLLGEAHPDTARSYNNLAINLREQGQPRQAIRAWQAALLGYDAGGHARAASGFDRALLGAGFFTPRDGLVLAHARLGEAGPAWDHAEASLARGLLDDLSGSLTEDTALLGQVRQLDQRLLPLLGRADLSADQARLRDELSQQRRSLQKRLAEDVAGRSARRVWAVERIQKQLPADAAVVLWVTARGENWGCVLRALGQPRWQRLLGTGPGDSWTLDDYDLPTRLHVALADRGSSESRRHDLIDATRKRWLDPLRPHLQAEGKLSAVRHIFVVPSRFMSALPVEVIAPDYTVSYTPSGTFLAQRLVAHRPLAPSAVLALGDPAFAPGKPADAPPHGLLVARVLPRSNAARAGLEAGDILLRYAGRKLGTIDDLSAALKERPQADAFVWREGKERTVALAGPLGVQLDKRPVADALRDWRKGQEPVLRGDDYTPLPGTRFEVEALARLFGKRCQTLLGSDASEQKLDELLAAGQLKRFRVVHLATHGKIDLDHAERSALILARDHLPSPTEQVARAAKGLKVYTGELAVDTLRTEWKEKLDADLVVLSACSTGLGRPTSGEGLLGFAYALHLAGARSIVLSRWKVDDTATALLMLRFYENLLGDASKGRKPLGRAVALAEAKKWLRDLPRRDAEPLARALLAGKLAGTRGKEVELKVKDDKATLPAGDRPYEHPFYWAAFTLIGDPD